MADRLPSLTALRAFDAAARHMSFAKAAEELFVTPAALSYQIKSLETSLGHPLFKRLNRAVELTEAGRALSAGTGEAFDTLMRTWRGVQNLFDGDVLTVTAGPAFTSKWLAPRLYDFAQEHPEIELRFWAGLKLVDLTRDEVDVAIRFGLGNDGDVYSRPLIKEWMTPMMTPELARSIKKPVDLEGAILIHDDSLRAFKSPGDWQSWAQAAGLSLDIEHGPRFSQADHALDAALSGVGVVLGRVSLATRALESGRLVAPFELGLISEAQFRFICPKGAETRPHVAAFESWVLKEIEASKSFEAGRRLIPASDIKPMS